MTHGSQDSPRLEILLVEDNPGDANLASMALSEAGANHNLSTVSDGQQALAFLRRQQSFGAAPRPDMVLLDLNMPVKDGREVLAEVKQDRDLKCIPVVVLTTSTSAADIKCAYELNANAYLTKPVDIDQFFELVRTFKEFWLKAVELPRLEDSEPEVAHDPPGEQPAEQEAAPPRERATGESACKVLVVEDNASDARLVELLLEEVDTRYQVEHVSHLKAALELLSQQRVDVVLLDLSLPDTHGLSTISAVNDAAPETPIIVLSGNTDRQLALEAVKVGAQDYLVKGEGDGHSMARVIRYAIERKRSECKLRERAEFDPLTGLANRTLFDNSLGGAMARADRTGQHLALLHLDIDKFKAVNDTLGHDAGDDLLIEVARRLSGCTRQGDTLARLVGDEFVVVLEGALSSTDAEHAAEKILQAMAGPYELKGRPISIQASIGMAVYPTDGADAASLLTAADAAMHRAKESGGRTLRWPAG